MTVLTYNKHSQRFPKNLIEKVLRRCPGNNEEIANKEIFTTPVVYECKVQATEQRLIRTLKHQNIYQR